LKDLFKVYAKTKGVDIEIGKAKTSKEAFKLLDKKLKGTLRASGFVTKKGEKIKPLSFGKEYRAAKSDAFRVVQKRTFRLGTSGEVKEIKKAKKTSKKKNSWLTEFTKKGRSKSKWL
jgi:hypothetical protein